jgi:hypothetical protein
MLTRPQVQRYAVESGVSAGAKIDRIAPRKRRDAAEEN